MVIIIILLLLWRWSVQFSSVTQLCPTLCDPMDCSPPGSSVHGILTLVRECLPFSLVQSLSCVQFFATSWTAAHQASLSITNSRSSLKLTSIESVKPSSHLILCRPLLLLPPIPPSIRVFSKESELGKQYYPLRKDSIYTTGMVKQTFLSLYRCTLYIKEGPVRQGLCYVQIFLCSLKNLNSIPS